MSKLLAQGGDIDAPEFSPRGKVDSFVPTLDQEQLEGSPIPLSNDSELPQTLGGTDITFTSLVLGMYTLVTVIGAILAIIYIIRGGLLYVAARDNPGTLTKGKDSIKYALIGLILIIGSFVLLNTINPRLLDFGLGLDKPEIEKELPEVDSNNNFTAHSFKMTSMAHPGDMRFYQNHSSDPNPNLTPATFSIDVDGDFLFGENPIKPYDREFSATLYIRDQSGNLHSTGLTSTQLGETVVGDKVTYELAWQGNASRVSGLIGTGVVKVRDLTTRQTEDFTINNPSSLLIPPFVISDEGYIYDKNANYYANADNLISNIAAYHFQVYADDDDNNKYWDGGDDTWFYGPYNLLDRSLCDSSARNGYAALNNINSVFSSAVDYPHFLGCIKKSSRSDVLRVGAGDSRLPTRKFSDCVAAADVFTKYYDTNEDGSRADGNDPLIKNIRDIFKRFESGNTYGGVICVPEHYDSDDDFQNHKKNGTYK